MNELEQEIEDLKSELSDKEDEIEKLKGELDDANVEISNLQSEIAVLEKEKDLIQDELDNTPELTEVDLGLDKILYHLDKGNLKVSQQLESAFNLIKS